MLLAPRLGAAWAIPTGAALSAGAVGLVKRGDPRPAALPWYLAAIARFLRQGPLFLHESPLQLN